MSKKQYTLLVVLVVIAGFLAGVVPAHGQTDSPDIDLPLPAPALRLGWQRITIPDVGTIDIPPSMEARSERFAEFARKAKKDVLHMGDEYLIRGVVIQQKGRNELRPEASEVYVRIILETDFVEAGEAETIDTIRSVSKAELRELSDGFREAITQELTQVGGFRIIEWYPPALQVINGMQALCISFKRQWRDNPPVIVKDYRFQNYDRIHHLTMSYRESEREKWLGDFPAILSSFRITNLQQGRSVLGPDGGISEVLGENWILTFIMSAILTWGIGLAPPLLIRYAIARKPTSKGVAIGIVIGFWFFNLILFIAMGSQSKTHFALFLVAMASYYILRAGAKTPKRRGQLPQARADTKGPNESKDIRFS